jgi:hypothetical protein
MIPLLADMSDGGTEKAFKAKMLSGVDHLGLELPDAPVV